MPFTTRVKVKAQLAIPSGITQHDAAIDDYVADANRTVLRALNLAGMTAQSYTEVLDVREPDLREVALHRMQVQSVTALTDNGAAVLAADRSFTREGIVSLSADGAYFTQGRRTVQVTYVAGFTTTDGYGFPPEDLVQAATLIACDGFNRGPHAGLESLQSGSNRTQLAPLTAEWYSRAMRILDSYRISML